MSCRSAWVAAHRDSKSQELRFVKQIGVLRLRDCFALRSSRFAQDDTWTQDNSPNRNTSASGNRLAHSFSLWMAPSSILTSKWSAPSPARRRTRSNSRTSSTTSRSRSSFPTSLVPIAMKILAGTARSMGIEVAS